MLACSEFQIKIIAIVLMLACIIAFAAACASAETENGDTPTGQIQTVTDPSGDPSTEAKTEPVPGAIPDVTDTVTDPLTEPDTNPEDLLIPGTNPATDPPAPAATQPGAQPATQPPTLPAQQPTEPVPAQPDEPVVLTITGSGVKTETAWTLTQLQAMETGYREYIYSTTNNWPSFGHVTAHGVTVRALLDLAGITDKQCGIKLIGRDGYFFTVTYDQIYETRYAYSRHESSGSGGPSSVEPVISWSWGEDGRARAEDLRFFIGQRGPLDVNTSAFVKNLVKIEVTSSSPGTWDAPRASSEDGSTIPSGTELHLMHDEMDNVTIYYTINGREPNYNSLVYNRSASYFQPHLTVPLEITGDITIKAFAAGLGKAPSPVVTFSYTLEQP